MFSVHHSRMLLAPHVSQGCEPRLGPVVLIGGETRSRHQRSSIQMQSRIGGLRPQLSHLTGASFAGHGENEAH